MKKKMFCPKCGATDKPLTGGFCVDCYIKDHPGIVEAGEVSFKQCPHCLRVYSKGDWASGSPEAVTELVKSRVKTAIESPSITVERVGGGPKHDDYDVTVEGSLDGTPVSITVPVRVRLERETCDVCSRKNGNYYEALVQLRPRGNTVDLDRLKTALIFFRNEAHAQVKIDRQAEIFRFELVKNGIDIYFGSARAAKVALQHFTLTYRPVVQVSYTLKGVDHSTGKRRYSVTYSVRL